MMRGLIINKTQKTQKKGVNLVEKKKKYEEASLELVYIMPTDVITTSTLGAEGTYDKDAWA